MPRILKLSFVLVLTFFISQVHGQWQKLSNGMSQVAWQLDESLTLYEYEKLQGLTNKSIDEMDMAIKVARSNGDTNLVMKARMNKAYYHYATGQEDLALNIATQISNNSKVIDAGVSFQALRLIRNIFLRQGDLSSAAKYHDQLDWNNEKDDTWEIEIPRYFTYVALFTSGNWSGAISKLETAISKSALPMDKLLCANYTLAHFYSLVDQPDSARNMYDAILTSLESSKIYNSTEKNQISAVVHGNLGELRLAEGDCLRSVPLLKMSLGSAGVTMNSFLINDRIRSLLMLTQCQIQIGNGQDAQLAAEQLKKLRSPYTALRYQNMIDLASYSVHKSFEKNGEALANLESIIDRSGSAMFRYNDFIKEHPARGTQVELKDFANNEEWVAEIEHLTDRLNREKWSQKMLVSVMIMLAIALAISLQSLWRWSKRDRKLVKKNKLIRQQTAEIRKTLKEKDVLLREVHHRVKNNLQIISSLFFLQSKKIDNPQAREIILEGQSRVQVMALIHQRLYQSEHLSEIDLHNYVNDLGKQIIQTHRREGLEVNLAIKIGDVNLYVDKAVPLGLIINELITNSIKHGFHGRKIGVITVDFTTTGRIGQLIFEDDGVGVENISTVQNSNSLGMKLIQLLTNQLNGVIEYHKANGFKMSLEFDI